MSHPQCRSWESGSLCSLRPHETTPAEELHTEFLQLWDESESSNMDTWYNKNFNTNHLKQSVVSFSQRLPALTVPGTLADCVYAAGITYKQRTKEHFIDVNVNAQILWWDPEVHCHAIHHCHHLMLQHDDTRSGALDQDRSSHHKLQFDPPDVSIEKIND